MTAILTAGAAGGDELLFTQCNFFTLDWRFVRSRSFE